MKQMSLAVYNEKYSVLKFRGNRIALIPWHIGVGKKTRRVLLKHWIQLHNYYEVDHTNVIFAPISAIRVRQLLGLD